MKRGLDILKNVRLAYFCLRQCKTASFCEGIFFKIMLTSLTVRNFKRLKSTDKIPLGEAVVFIGPNNSGKTTGLQALMLWQFGVQKWLEKRSLRRKGASGSNGSQRTGVALNRKDLFAIPIAQNKALWSDLFVMGTTRDASGKNIPRDVNIEIEVEGITNGQTWQCGLEFEYRDEEVIYCRPLRNFANNVLLEYPEWLQQVKIAFLPPMSGLKTEEEKLLPQTVEARIGEGRTAEVLRNICYAVLYPETERQRQGRNPEQDWNRLCTELERLFLISLQKPEINSRGELMLFYKDHQNNRLEIAAAGRGFQQILLLLSYMLTNPNTLLLFDEPDAHLEVLKQRELYNLLKDLAIERNIQIIAASHSEVILQESASEDIVVAFLPAGKPHKINDRGSQTLKALNRFGFDHYVLGEQRGWVLYLEGSTDLDMLRKFAEKLAHPAKPHLDAPFVHYLGTNQPAYAREHFRALKEALPHLKAVALFDRIDNPLESGDLLELKWQRRELENYFFQTNLFLIYAAGASPSDLFAATEQQRRQQAMQEALDDVLPAYARRTPEDEFWKEEKASEWMERIFRHYFQKLNLPVSLSKNKYFQLIDYLSPSLIDPEVRQKLDAIEAVAKAAISRT